MRVDVSGLPCPRPTAVVRRRLSALDADEDLLVVGAGQASESSIRRACERRGFDVRVVSSVEEGDDDAFSLRIRATEFASL